MVWALGIISHMGGVRDLFESFLTAIDTLSRKMNKWIYSIERASQEAPG